MGSLHVYAVSLVTVAVVGVLRVRDAKSHVPNNVPGAFASNTCKDTCCGAGTSFFSRGPTFGMSFIGRGPTFQIWAKDATGESIPLDVTGSTTVENLKQMIWEKVGVPAAEQFLKFGAKMLEDGRTLSDYNIQMASTVDLLLFVCGGGKNKSHSSQTFCDKCKQLVKSAGFNMHYKFCGVSKDGTTAPGGYQQSPIPCYLCGLGRKLVNGVLCGVCKYWGKLKHLGHPDYPTFYQTKLQQKNDERATGGQSRGDDRVKWNETYPGAPNGETRLQALKRFVEENPWWHRSLHQPQFESLALRLGVDDWQKVGAQLRQLDPADANGYISTMNYRRLVDACLTLANFRGGDPMFGGIAPLTIKLVAGLVHGAIAVALSTRIRSVKSLQRKNAAGGQSREGVIKAIYNWANGDDETEGALLENDRLSGLRGIGSAGALQRFGNRWGHLGGFDLGLSSDCLVVLRDRCPRIFRIAPHQLLSFIGCDFGNLGKQDTVYQALNVKAEGDRLVGDSTTRAVSRAHNNAIAAALSRLVATVTLELHIKLHAGLIIVYKNLGGFHWKGNLTNAYKHFSETYDPLVFAEKSSDSWRSWLKQLLESDGCGGVCDGYDICFFIGGRRVGRDLLREPMDVAIYDAIDQNLLRIARGIDWTLSHLPTVEWTSDETLLSLRTSCLEAGMGKADDALRLYYLFFKKELEAALASGRGVSAALETGYAALREGPTMLRSTATFLRTVRTNFELIEAPAILRELAQPRRVELRTYTMQGASNELWSAPVSVFELVERAVSAEATLHSSGERTPPPSPVREHSAGPTAFPISGAAKRAADDSGGWTKARGGGPQPVVPPGSPEV
jgi:large subunit ribosomal protein L40e